MTLFAPARETLRELQPRRVSGRISSVRGLTVLVDQLRVPVGSIVRVDPVAARDVALRGEVVGFQGDAAIVMLYDDAGGIAPGDSCVAERNSASVHVGEGLLGRVVDGLGRPLDGRGLPAAMTPRPLHPTRLCPLQRDSISSPISTGIRVIDGLHTIGRGQRLGVFSGPGVGKSTLIGSIARNTSAEVNVIALVGERGREVTDFLHETLGPEGLARSVVVVATGDESPLLRVRACYYAMAVAEHFRDRGLDVLLTLDSLTRFAHAQRQIGLAVGEQPATKGFTPSVFAMLPRILERAGGLRDGGSITGIYTVLVEGDELTDPVADAAKGVLDGHLVLNRSLAQKGQYPAVDPLASISRASDRLVDEHVLAARRSLMQLLAALDEAEELVTIGAYVAGSNPEVDIALALKGELTGFLKQSAADAYEFPRTCRLLLEMHGLIEGMRQQLSRPASGNGVAL